MAGRPTRTHDRETRSVPAGSSTRRPTRPCGAWATTGSYRDCVLAAVNLGNDADTTACVAGAMAGVRYGYGAIPAEWLKALRGAPMIEALADAAVQGL